MPGHTRSLRGDINAILNPLVANGVIMGFSTNLYEKPAPEQMVVTIVPRSRKEAADAQRAVAEALAPLGEHIAVNVDLREGDGHQGPESSE